MADEIDCANEQAERNLADSMRMRRPAGPEATGHCLFCGETVSNGHRWCDALCRDQWEVRCGR
jgi:hypothetical protein